MPGYVATNNMSTEMETAASVPETITEPAPPEEVTEPVPDTAATEAPVDATAPAEEVPESTEASDTTVEDEDPFAEFIDSGVKNKDFYEAKFKTNEWKHVPHLARDEIRSILDEKEAVEATINDIGGRPVLDTFKPMFAAVMDPNPSPEVVDAAFDTLNDHNPKVMEQLGAQFTKHWVQEVVADPVTNLNPLLQHVFQQFFGQQGGQYDLNRLLEFAQLDMARDSDGEPILDLDTARQLFDMNGGHNAFKFQQEKAEYERRIQELTNGYQQPATPASQPQTAAPDHNVDADLEKEILPTLDPILAKIGYKKGDEMHSIITDALKYRLRNAPEADRIRAAAQSGIGTTADGKTALIVSNNKQYLANRLKAQLITEMKAVQGKFKGTAAAPSKPSAPAPAAKQAATHAQTPAPPRQPVNTTPNTESFIADVAARAKAKLRESQDATAIAAGR